jgi:hypothetical protein
MRMYEMLMGPLSVSKPWSTTGISAYTGAESTGIWRITEEKEFTDAPPS